MNTKILRFGLCLLFYLICFTSAAQIKTVSGKSIYIASMDLFIKSEMDSIGMPAMSIAIFNGGKVVYNRSFGVANVDTKIPANDSSIFEAASMSKPVFAYLVMRLIDKGVLNLDTPLYRYMPYPDIAGDERYKLITARMCLSHRTGFPNWRYFDMADSAMHIKYGDLYLKFTPGTEFYYSGEGFLYLAKVIAHLTGKTLQTLEGLYEEEVAVPLDMQHAWFTGNRYITEHKVSGHKKGKPYISNHSTWPIPFPDWDSSYFNPAASLHTDAISYAHFLIGLMNGKGLSKKSLDEMLRVQVLHSDDDGDSGYGLGIFIGETPYGTRYEHGGSNGNFQSGSMFFKKQKDGYVFLTNCDRGNDFNKKLRSFLTNGTY